MSLIFFRTRTSQSVSRWRTSTPRQVCMPTPSLTLIADTALVPRLLLICPCLRIPVYIFQTAARNSTIWREYSKNASGTVPCSLRASTPSPIPAPISPIQHRHCSGVVCGKEAAGCVWSDAGCAHSHKQEQRRERWHAVRNVSQNVTSVHCIMALSTAGEVTNMRA